MAKQRNLNPKQMPLQLHNKAGQAPQAPKAGQSAQNQYRPAAE